MAIDKEIRINVDDSPLNKLRQQAESLARDMIRASREFSTSGDEVIADLEEQIMLMERRNRINKQYAESQIQQARRAGQVTPQVAQQQFQAVGQQVQEQKILVDLVREVIETLKQTSKDEIRADREDVERRIRASRTVGELGPPGDPAELLKETLQRQYLGMEGEPPTGPSEDGRTRARERNNRIRRRVEQTLNKIAGAENEYAALASGFEGIPGVGPALATVLSRGVQAAESYQQAAVAYGRQNLFGIEHLYPGLSPIGRGRLAGTALRGQFGDLGLTPGEGLSAFNAFQGTLQRTLGVSEGFNVLGAQRTLGLDSNVIQQLLTTSRYDRSANDPSRILGQFDKYLRDTGRMVTMIPELVGTFTSAASQILATRGDVDTQALAGVITNIQRRTGFEGVRLERLTGAFGQLGRTANPVTRALLMRAFRETDPNLSFVDIQERLEGGISEVSRPGLQRFFEILRERTGGGDALTLALQTALPQLSIRDIRDVIKSGGFSKALQRQQIEGDRDFAVEGREFVTPIERSSKRIAGLLEVSGDAFVQVIDDLKNKFLSILGDLEAGRAIRADTGVGGEIPAKTESEKIVAKNAEAILNNPVF